jgi:hypothetical protein
MKLPDLLLATWMSRRSDLCPPRSARADLAGDPHQSGSAAEPRSAHDPRQPAPLGPVSTASTATAPLAGLYSLVRPVTGVPPAFIASLRSLLAEVERDRANWTRGPR